MVRPRPVPPNRRVVEASAWEKASKMWSARSSGMPTPVSLTWISKLGAVRPGALPRDDHVDPAGLGELHPVAKQVDQDLAEAGDVAHHLLRQVGREMAGHGQPLRRRRRHQVEVRGDAVAQVEGLVLELEAARLDLREVEDVVDQGQQGVAAGADGFDVVALLEVEIGLEQEPGHADHPVERGADLVAHVGQELAFSRLAASAASLAARRSRSVRSCWVVSRARPRICGALPAAGVEPQLDLEAAVLARFGAHVEPEGAVAFADHHLVDGGDRPRPVVGQAELEEGLAQPEVAREAGQRLEGGIEVGEGAVAHREGEDHRRRGVDQGAEMVALVADLAGAPLERVLGVLEVAQRLADRLLELVAGLVGLGIGLADLLHAGRATPRGSQA